MTSVDHADNSSTHTTVATSDGSATYSKLFFHNLTNLRPSVAPIKELKGPVGQIQHIDRVVLAVEQVLLHYIFQNVSFLTEQAWSRGGLQKRELGQAKC